MLSVKIDSESYNLTDPVSISRTISIESGTTSQAFHLPKISSSPVEIGEFIGDIQQGGSCNVNVLQFTPHNLTHIETPQHVSEDGLNLSDLSRDLFSGLACVLDLSDREFSKNYIMPTHLSNLSNYPQATILVLKTPASDLSEFHNFSGTDPLSFHPKTTQWLTKQYPEITLVVIDLPSMDKEDDGGQLAAHKNYFNTNNNPKGDAKVLVELAYLNEITNEGYYYLQSTVPKIDTDAFIVDLVLYHLDK